MVPTNHNRVKNSSFRRGVSTMMTLIFLPCLVVLTIMVSEIGSLYVAKTELRHSLESGALGAVRHLQSDKSDLAAARAAALAYTAANLVRNECIDIDRRIVLEPETEHSPEMLGTAGKITFGSVAASRSGGWIFLPAIPPTKGSFAAVQLEMKQPITGNVSEIFGLKSPNYEVRGSVTARLTDADQPQLVRTTNETP